MNKLIHSLIIIIVTLILCFVSFKNTNIIAKKSLEYVEKIESLTNNNKNNYQEIKELDEFWNKKSKILQILIHHEQIEDINSEIAKLKLAIQEKNKFEILKICNYLNSKLKNLEKIDEISIENIL